jgi:hypothetical protein
MTKLLTYSTWFVLTITIGLFAYGDFASAVYIGVITFFVWTICKARTCYV